MELKPPRKKTYCKKKPVSFTSLLELKNQIRGYFNNFSVIVKNDDAMQQLHSKGCFGKANLSRSYPTSHHNQTEIVRRRIYDRRKLWGTKCISKISKKIIVTPDSDLESDYFTNLKPEYCTDNSTLKEVLNLSLEEACFLQASLKCLQIYHQEKLLDANSTWCLFANTDRYFTQNYLIYHYFRSKNWIVKPGVKFGGDYLLYKDGPAFYHASYLVVIDILDQTTLQRKHELVRRSMEVTNMVALNRLCETVGKIDKFPLGPLEGHLEIEVQCCGLNFSDLYTRQGLMRQKLPMVLGTECMGIVRKLGIETDQFKVGQRVVCFDYNGGIFRNILRIAPSKCYPLPDHVTNEQGAALFINYLTAYFALFDAGGLKPNSTVLILSCAGGVGCAATQLAKTVEGVTVVGTASLSKKDKATANGVDIVLSYDNLEEQINTVCPNGFDLILDNQAGKVCNFLQTKLKQLGKIVLMGANTMLSSDKKLSLFPLLKVWWQTNNVVPRELIMNSRGVAGLHLGMVADKEPEKVAKAFDTVCTLLKEKKINPVIHECLKIEDIVTASKMLAERKNVGKVILNMN